MNWRGTTLRDWLLLAIGLAFVAISLAMLVGGRDGTAPLATFAFFGMCTVVFIHRIGAKLRMHAVDLDPSAKLHIAGGVPLVASRTRAVGLSFGIAALGVFLAITGAPIGGEFVAVCVLMAALGVAMLVAVALGAGKRPTLTFTPEGLRMSTSSISYLARWDVVSVRLVVIQSQSFIGVWLRESARLVADAQVSRGDVVVERAKLAARIEKSLRWTGVHLTVFGPAYSVETLLLLRALQRYIDNPTARAELR